MGPREPGDDRRRGRPHRGGAGQALFRGSLTRGLVVQSRGPAGGHDRRARQHARLRRRARRQRAPARARPVGPRRAARLAVVASAAGASSAEVLLMPETNHVIGLLLGTEEDWPMAFETLIAR